MWWPFGRGWLADRSGRRLRRLTQPYCDGLIRAATVALDARNPGHANIRQTSVYQEREAAPDASGLAHIDTRSEPVLVVRFDLADGTLSAIGVLDVPGDPVALDYGP